MKSSKKDWFAALVRDWSPVSSSSKPEANGKGSPSKHRPSIPTTYKCLAVFFAVIGILGTIRWFLSFFISLDAIPPTVTSHHQASVSHLNPDFLQDQACADAAADCPWSHVFSDMTNRLQLLELAFKEQVFARESIAKEINNQTDVYGSLERKLTLFLDKLDNMTDRFLQLENKYAELSQRVYSDEILGVLVVFLVLVDLMAKCRHQLQNFLNRMSVYKPRLLPDNKLERKNSSNPSTPKHCGALRNEICIIYIQRESSLSCFTNLTDAMLRHLEGVKLAVRPYFAVYSQDDLRNIPHVRLYVIIVDMETRGSTINGSEKDLALLTVKFTKSLGGHVVIVIANDEGSKKLTAHSMYNTSIRLVKTSDVLQEMASNGRLFSMWQEMTSHQLSHLRRVIKTVLNVKPVMR